MIRIIGYAFDGAMYHVDCLPDSWLVTCTCGSYDKNGVCDQNCHGYGPNPVFSTDEMEGDEMCDGCLLALEDD
jgi:hypothetical protein